MEFEWASACRGGNLRTCWWTPVVKEAVRLKKGLFRAWVSQRCPDTAERYRLARRAAASEFTKTKTLVWEEFREAMEKDFQLAPQKFWQTLRRLKNGKQGMAQAVTRWGADLLTV